MENSDEQLPGSSGEKTTAPAENAYVIPRKYEKPEQDSSNIWIRSVISLAFYLVAGYYIFKRWEILFIITGIVMIHELGHFIAMKAFGYRDLGIFFIPLLGAYASGSKRDVSQKQSAIILLAGPLPGILTGILFCMLDKDGTVYYLAHIPLSRIGLLFIFLNLLNLLPVYPLDGGQLLNRVFLDEESIISKIFIFISVALMGWFAISMYRSSGNSFYFVLLLFPLSMILRLAGEKKLTSIERRLEKEGFPLDREYEDISDEEYWKIRNILIEEHPAFRDLPQAPPYEYSAKEEKIMSTIQSLLHRHLIQDVSALGKILIFLIWAVSFASPWLLNVNMEFFRQFGL